MTTTTRPNAVRRPRRAAFARLGVVIVLGATSIVGTAGSCWACSCAAQSPREQARLADAVFVATVTAVDDSEVGTSSGDPVHYVATVEEVHKGTVRRHVVVDSVAAEGSCGLEGMREGGRYVFLATGSGEAFASGLCSGTRPLAAGAPLPDLGLPAAVAPTENAPPTDAATGPAPRPADGGSSGWWRPAALLALGVGLTAFAIRARRQGPH